MRTWLAMAVVLAASSARAGPMGRTGFELHAELGAGYAHSQARMNGFTQSVSGIGVMHSLGLGFGSVPGFTAGAEYWGSWVYGPTVETRGPGSGDGLQYRVWGVGPSVRWVHSTGLYAQLTPSLSRVTLSDNDANGFEWEYGFGARLSAGKLWLVEQSWLLGVAAVALYSTNASREIAAPRWNSLGAGLVLSAALR